MKCIKEDKLKAANLAHSRSTLFVDVQFILQHFVTLTEMRNNWPPLPQNTANHIIHYHYIISAVSFSE